MNSGPSSTPESDGWCSQRASAVSTRTPSASAGPCGASASQRARSELEAFILQQGIETVGDDWFAGSEIEKLVVPGSVRTLGRRSFARCRVLREVVFEPDSQLDLIGEACFTLSALEKVAVSKSVTSIGARAFSGCRNLSLLRFEPGSRLERVGEWAFHNTRLGPENVAYPDALKTSGREW